MVQAGGAEAKAVGSGLGTALVLEVEDDTELEPALKVEATAAEETDESRRSHRTAELCSSPDPLAEEERDKPLGELLLSNRRLRAERPESAVRGRARLVEEAACIFWVSNADSHMVLSSAI